MPTIKDVACLADTSIATVSRYLNGETIREKNRLRVKEAIAELGYYPNQAAKTLKTNRSSMVGMIVSSLDSLFNSRLSESVQMHLYESNYSLLAMSCQHDLTRLEPMMQFLLRKGAEALIIACGCGLYDECAIQSAIDGSVPIVVLDNVIEGCDSIIGDGDLGAYLATRHLIERGHERVAFLGGPGHIESARTRCDGFVRAMNEAGLPVRPEYLRLGDYDERHGRDGLTALLDLTERPTALLTANHHISMGVLEVVYSKGVDIPGELSFIMYDELIPIDILPTKLSTVTQPTADMGSLASELVQRRLLKDPPLPPPGRCYRLPPRLVIRESVKDCHDHKTGGTPHD